MHAWMFLLLGLLPATAPTTPATECPDFAANLETCTPYKCQFTHPFTGEKMERNIIGVNKGTCAYVEQMPNGGRMECGYDETLRKRMAHYFAELQATKAAGTDVESDFHISADAKGTKSSSTTKVNGKVMDNPLQEAFDKGVCKILGYNLSASGKSKTSSSTTSTASASHSSSTAQSSVSTHSVTAADRDRNERIIRTMKARQEFMKMTEHPYGWKDHVITYIVPLCKGGTETPSNMQWQTAEAANAKEKTDCAQQ